MALITRRTLLKRVGNASAGALLATQASKVSAFAGKPQPHIDFPTNPRDRLAIASWPFRAYIEAPTNEDRDPKVPGMDLKDFAAHVAAKFNVRNIEPYNWHFSSREPAYLAAFRDALAKTNSHVANIAVDGEHSFYDAEPSARKQAVAFAKQWIDVAVSIGAPSIRANDPQAKNSAPNLDRVVEGLRQVVDYAAGKNIVVNLENDNAVSEDPFFLVKVIEAVDHPYLRALPDFGNSMQKGDADFNYKAVQAMFAHAYCICHVKDGVADQHGKPFYIDLEKTFRILKSSGYRGYCSMEFDRQGDPHDPTTKLVEQSIRLLS